MADAGARRVAQRGARPLLSIGETVAIFAMLAADMGRGQPQEFVRMSMAKACRTEATRQLNQLSAARQQGQSVSVKDVKIAERLARAVVCNGLTKGLKQESMPQGCPETVLGEWIGN